MDQVPQKLQCEPRLRQRVLSRVYWTHMHHTIDSKLHLLLGPRRWELEHAIDNNARASGNKLAKVGLIRLDDHLQVARAGTVVEFQKCEGILVSLPTRFDPTANPDLLVCESGAAIWSGNYGSDGHAVGELSFENFGAVV